MRQPALSLAATTSLSPPFCQGETRPPCPLKCAALCRPSIYKYSPGGLGGGRPVHPDPRTRGGGRLLWKVSAVLDALRTGSAGSCLGGHFLRGGWVKRHSAMPEWPPKHQLPVLWKGRAGGFWSGGGAVKEDTSRFPLGSGMADMAQNAVFTSTGYIFFFCGAMNCNETLKGGGSCSHNLLLKLTTANKLATYPWLPSGQVCVHFVVMCLCSDYTLKRSHSAIGEGFGHQQHNTKDCENS